MKTRTKKTAKKIQSAAWQWDPATLTLPQIQYWSATGIFRGLLSLDKARELVASGAYFCGGPNFINEMHDGIALPK